MEIDQLQHELDGLERRVQSLAAQQQAAPRQDEASWPAEAASALHGMQHLITALRREGQRLGAHPRREEWLRLLEAATEQTGESIVITEAELDEPGPRIVFANPAFARMTGFAVEEILGKTPRVLQGPATERAVLERLRDHLSREQPFHGQTVNYRKDGTPFVLAWHIAPIRDEAGLITHWVSVQRDVTEQVETLQALRRATGELEQQRAELLAMNEQLQEEIAERGRTEQALRQSRSLLAEAERVAHLGSWSWDVRQDRLAWSDETYCIFGLDPRSFRPTYETFLALVHPDDRPRVERLVRTARVRREAQRGEFKILRPGGEVRVVDGRAEIRTDETGKAVQVVGTLHDVTEQRRLEAELLRITEQERQRVGRELHDGLGQQLAGATLLSRALGQRLERKALPEATAAAEVTEILEASVEQTRDLSKLLLPVELDEFGLEAALLRLAAHAETVYDVTCTFRPGEAAQAVGRDVALHLYRIAQEAVHNAIRHGRATHVRIRLYAEDEEVLLVVRDDGLGFTEEEAWHGEGMGIRSMQYRARLIGARLDVRTHQNRGTTVRCVVPPAAQGSPARNEAAR